MVDNRRTRMRGLSAILAMMMLPPALAVEWSIELCSSLDLLAGRTGIADVRPSNDPHTNSPQMVEQNSGIYRGQWSWQNEMPELLYEMMHSGRADAVSPSGFTALQAACVYADEALFQALLDAGVPVDQRPGDWQQLGYVGDTPLGLLVRFMTPRSSAARVRMARKLLEKGANPDALMTSWKGNRVVSVVPFCELGNQECNHELRLLLLQYGEQDLPRRMAGWSLNWDAYRADLVQHLNSRGVARNAAGPRSASDAGAVEPVLGRVPLLDLIRKGDAEGVRMALEAGASIEVSDRAYRYGQEPLFNIPARRKDSPEVAVEIARLLVEAGADVNALNRRGNSLRIHYDRFYSKASRALCAYFKDCGALIHPDSPDRKEHVEQVRKEAQQRAAAFAARRGILLQPVAEEPAVEEPAPAPQSVAEQPAVEEPAPAPPPVAEQPAVEEPAPAPQPVAEQPAAEEPAPAPQPVAEQPAVEEPAPAPQPVAEQPAAEDPAPAPQPVAEDPAAEEPAPAPQPVAEQPAAEQPSLQELHQQKLMQEVQAQLAELQARFEAEQQAKAQQEESANQENTEQ